MMRKLINAHDCRDVSRHLCADLDYRLTTRECREIRRHLRECPNCTAYLDSLKKTVVLYRAEPRSKLGSAARTKLHAVLKLRLR